MYFGTKPYDLEAYIEHRGDGSNMFRGEDFGQPQTLQPGDILANGLVIAENSYEAGNGGVGLKFTDGSERVIPARIPLLLDSSNSGKVPSQLSVGDVFVTGDVVLSPPEELDVDDPRFEERRHETVITITGGLNGHSIEVPGDVVIALHNETYPPNQNTVFGAFVVENALKMGARARKNLPNYGRLNKELEFERVSRTFDEIAVLRTRAYRERAAYHETVTALEEQCGQLKGVELVITGRLHGRGGTQVHRDDPESLVENLCVEVTRASVNTYEGHGSLVLPFIEIYGRTVETGESVGAWLDVGDFGVTAEVIKNELVQD